MGFSVSAGPRPSSANARVITVSCDVAQIGMRIAKHSLDLECSVVAQWNHRPGTVERRIGPALIVDAIPGRPRLIADLREGRYFTN